MMTKEKAEELYRGWNGGGQTTGMSRERAEALYQEWQGGALPGRGMSAVQDLIRAQAENKTSGSPAAAASLHSAAKEEPQPEPRPAEPRPAAPKPMAMQTARQAQQQVTQRLEPGPDMSLGQRVGLAARGMGKRMVASVPVEWETTKTAQKDLWQNQGYALQRAKDRGEFDPETASPHDLAMDRRRKAEAELGEIEGRLKLLGLTGRGKSPEAQELKARKEQVREEVKQTLQEEEGLRQKTTVDPDHWSMQKMAEAQELSARAREGLSKPGQIAFALGENIAQNAAMLPLGLINPALPLSAMGSMAAGEKMAELNSRGIPADEASWRGLASGLIEAGTEKIGLDNLTDTVLYGGKEAVKSGLRRELRKHLNGKGMDLLAGMTSEGLEEVIGYMANFAMDKVAQDPEARFEWDELLAGGLMGAAAGGVLGGAGHMVHLGKAGAEYLRGGLSIQKQKIQAAKNAGKPEQVWTKEGSIRQQARQAQAEKGQPVTYGEPLPELHHPAMELAGKAHVNPPGVKQGPLKLTDIIPGMAGNGMAEAVTKPGKNVIGITENQEKAAQTVTEPAKNVTDRPVTAQEAAAAAGYEGSPNAKSTQEQQRIVRTAAKKISTDLGLPGSSIRDKLTPGLAQLAETWKTSGKLPASEINRLFDRVYEDGVVEDTDFYDQYKEAKAYMRGTPIQVDSEIRDNSKAEYKELLGRSRGRMRMVAKNGLPIDVAYRKMLESYPGLLDPEITAPADQWSAMLDASEKIQKVEYGLAELYGPDFKADARAKFQREVEAMMPDLQKVRRYEIDQTKQKGPTEVPEAPSFKEVQAAAKAAVKAQRQADKIMRRAMLTAPDQVQLKRLRKGEITPEQLAAEGAENLKDIMKVFEAQKAVDEARKPVEQYNRAVAAQRLREAEEAIEDTMGWKDKINGWLYARETMERNIQDISGGSKAGQSLIAKYFKPIHEHEAQATKFKRKWKDKIRNLNLNDAEAKYTQVIGEIYGVEAAEKMGIPRPEGEVLALRKAQKQLLEQYGDKIDEVKCQEAVQVFRKVYDQLFKAMNEIYVRNGYPPIDYREWYFPHFTKDVPDGLMQKAAAALGFDIKNDNLPTDIAGLTHTFKPGRRYNPFAKERTGWDTTYDAVEGFDRYLEVAADVIYHTEDIRNLRALEDALRGKYGPAGIREKIRQIRADETLTEEERQAQVDKLKDLGMDHLSYFVQGLNEYTNLLAGKKSHHDRMAEQDFGRRVYQAMVNVENRVAANMVAVNPASWLTNFIPITQATGEVDVKNLLRAGRDTLAAMAQNDGFEDGSVFLTNRRGYEPLVQTASQKIASKFSEPMQWIDMMTANIVVRGKYIQNLEAGMTASEAMENADAFAAGLMADRSKGALPTYFERKNPLAKVLTMYQVEVNNQLSYMWKDLPKAVGGRASREMAKAMVRIMLGAYIFNDLYELFTGRRAATDPMGLVNEAMGGLTGFQVPNMFQETGRLLTGRARLKDFTTKRKGLTRTMGETGKEIAEEIPFVGGLLGGGRVPIQSAVPDLAKVGTTVGGLIEGDVSGKKARRTIGKELAKPATYLLPPVGGGQVKKAVEGAGVLARRGSYQTENDGSERLQFALENPSLLDVGRNLVFGKWSSPEAQEYIRNRQTKSVGYTKAYKDGHSTSVLDALYPESRKKAGAARYAEMFPEREGAKEVDSWLQELQKKTDRNVMPSNTSASVRDENGEPRQLSGSEALAYTTARQSAALDLLEPLPRWKDSLPDEIQVAYVQDVAKYARLAAEQEITGNLTDKWMKKVQEISGASGSHINDELRMTLLAYAVIGETEADKHHNGKPVTGSRERKALKNLQELGLTANEARGFWEKFK